jgi:hypothetical protein
MSAKEIAYNSIGVMGHCPACGKPCDDGIRFSCETCWANDAVNSPGRAGFGGRVDVGRDWFYNRGVQLRADGRMPPLKRANVDQYDKCAPIWTAAMWNKDGTLFGWCCGGLGARSESPQDYDTIRRVKGESSYIGPVQLATDPPQPPAANPHFGQPPALAKKPEPRVGSCCALSWCSRPVSQHTDDDAIRCASYLTEREGIIGQYDKYVRELKVPRPLPGEPCGDVGSWAAHAARRREDALAALEAQFRALTFIPTKE